MSRELQHREVLQFVHVTDTHLLNRAAATLHGLNTKKTLEAVLSHSRVHCPDIDFLLFTGDISQTGNAASYTLFASVIQRYDLPVYCVPGNHDAPALLRRIIPTCPDDTINVIQLDKFSLILLSSWVQDKHHGLISRRCLQQLERHLSNSQDRFNIIAVHHPPVSINSKWLDEIGLQNKAEFLQTIHNYHQHALLLFGHIHQEVDQQLEKLRLLATPSTCYQYQANCEYARRVYQPPAYRFVRLTATGNVETKVCYVGQV